MSEKDEALASILKWLKNPDTKQIYKLGGLAGTGKTTLIKDLMKATREAKLSGDVCAFTGKAVNVLRKKDIHATTIHSLIYEWNGRKFVRRDSLYCDFIVIDEASMVNYDLITDLKSYRLPILAVGDYGQLEPIGDDPNLMKNLDFTLKTIHRQTSGSSIIDVAHRVRNGDHPYYAINNIGGSECSIKSPDDFNPRHYNQVICAFNNQRDEINSLARELRNFTTPLEHQEKLICLRNDYSHGVFNGQLALYDADKDTLLLDDGRKIYHPSISRETLTTGKPPKFGVYDSQLHFTYGYAITVHKAQGSEWDKVAVIPGYTPSWDMTRWNYTAVTRASNKLVWVDE